MVPAVKEARIAPPAMLFFAALLASVAITPATAQANACQRFADAHPERITQREASRAVVCLVNHRRQARGISALRANAHLHRAARRHSHYMETHHCFSHECSGEPTLSERLKLVGYLGSGLRTWLIGENEAWDGRRATPRNVVRTWMRSPGHRANMLDPSFRDIGVGVIWGTPENPDAKGGIYTADFGMRN
jgi:uncharacterized protein YkwD